jgi:tRNA (guanine-N7-)-methyltransferase
VTPDFARLAAQRLRPGGLWRLATDWPDYAVTMQQVLDAEPLLANVHDGPSPRWEDRPLTRFERRGLAAGRSVTDLTYLRVDPPDEQA